MYIFVYINYIMFVLLSLSEVNFQACKRPEKKDKRMKGKSKLEFLSVYPLRLRLVNMILYLSLYLSLLLTSFLPLTLYFSFLSLCPKRLSPYEWAMRRQAPESPAIISIRLCVCHLIETRRWGGCWYGSLVIYVRVYTSGPKTTYPEARVLVRKLSQLTLLS
jgi:hypothetical protein